MPVGAEVLAGEKFAVCAWQQTNQLLVGEHVKFVGGDGRAYAQFSGFHIAILEIRVSSESCLFHAPKTLRTFAGVYFGGVHATFGVDGDVVHPMKVTGLTSGATE